MNILSKEEILSKIFSLHRFGIKPGLERTLALLDKLSNPQKKIKAIHVAGTNGKGSVCSSIASVLTEAGYKVGLYTSPHIFEFNERVRINGVMISDEDLVRIGSDILEKAESFEATFFEITSAIAFQYFFEQSIDIAVIETGMGGRFDSTNVINPIVSVITSIDLDHKEYLGETLEEIAFQKAGIIKAGVPCIVSDNHPNLFDVFTKEAEKVGTKVAFAEDIVETKITEYLADLSMYVDVKSPIAEYTHLNCRLAGEHQANNLKAVILALESIKSEFNWTYDNLNKGLTNVYEYTGLIGRVEVMSLHPLIILDVAHNPASMSALVTLLHNCGYGDMKFDFIFAAMQDKDYSVMLEKFQPLCDKLILSKPKIDRAAEVSDLEASAKALGFANIEKIPSIKTAVKYAIDSERPIIICGSFYLAGEAMEVLENYLAANNLEMF